MTEPGLQIGLPEPTKVVLNSLQDFIDGKATSRRPTGQGRSQKKPKCYVNICVRLLGINNQQL